MTDEPKRQDPQPQDAQARITELEQRIDILEASQGALGKQTSHLIRLLGETRRELRATWKQQKRDAAEGKN